MYYSSVDTNISGVTEFALAFKALSSVHSNNLLLKCLFDLQKGLVGGSTCVGLADDLESGKN